MGKIPAVCQPAFSSTIATWGRGGTAAVDTAAEWVACVFINCGGHPPVAWIQSTSMGTTIPTKVVQRFAFKQNLHVVDAQQLFAELEQFLDQASVRKSNPSAAIDRAWHEFILHTRDYIKFCEQRYGRVIHHVPTSPLAFEDDEHAVASSGVRSGASAIPLHTCDSDCSSD